MAYLATHFVRSSVEILELVLDDFSRLTGHVKNNDTCRKYNSKCFVRTTLQKQFMT